MCAQRNAAPVIIKRKKVVSGGGHHGGAWKVAYADFVTAMMAFFLLMWLLNATTEQQRKGVADYFSPTIAVNRISGGGEGFFGGESVLSQNALAQEWRGCDGQPTDRGKEARGEIGVSADGGGSSADKEAFASIETALSGRSGESMVDHHLLRHIVTRVTDEGLVIELFDLDGLPLFEMDGDTPMPILHDLAQMLAQITDRVVNPIALNGHVSARPVVLIANPSWDLSNARANRMRLLLEDAGMESERIKRLSGHADRKPAVRNPMAGRNNRLEVILLRTQ